MSAATAARREREEQDYQRQEKDKRELHELLLNYRRIPLWGNEAQAAWRRPEIRSFYRGRDSGGSQISTVLRGEDSDLYLQEASFPGWSFAKLVPRFHVLREAEANAIAALGSRSH